MTDFLQFFFKHITLKYVLRYIFNFCNIAIDEYLIVILIIALYLHLVPV